MAFPTPKVYIAFDDGPYVASPTWTEVTDYVFSADVNRGRSDDYSNVVGTAYVVLNNNTRLFDPFNTAGTYYGKLLPRRQIKIEAVSESTTFPVFRGYIAGWPAQFDNAGKTGTVSLQCFDALALLAQELLPDYVATYTQTLAPVHYYRLNDPLGQGFIQDIGSRPSNLSIVFYQQYLKTGSVVPALTSEAVQFVSPYISAQNTATSDNAISVSMWLDNTSGINSPYGGDFKFKQARIETGFNNVGEFVVGAYSSTTYYFQKYALLAGGSGSTHIAITFSGSTLKVYLNGQDATVGGSSFANAYDQPERVELDGPVIQEVSVYNYVLSAAQITNLYNFGFANLVETTAARFSRLLAYTSFPAALTSATTTPVASVAAIGPVAANLTSELALVNNSEGGVMYVSKSGVLTFQDRNFVYTNTKSNTVQATLATGSIGYEPQVSMEYSGDNLRNAYQVNYSAGGYVQAINTVSAAAYGKNATTLDTQLSTVDQANTLASYEATVGGALLSDISPVKAGVAGVTADWTTLLGLELFERYTITVNPATGSAFSQTQLINSIRHSIVPGKYEMTIDGSARYTAWFILNKSSLNGPDLLQ
jgi:hypothetical protein